MLGLVSFGVAAYFQIVTPSLVRPTSALGAATLVTVASSMVLSGLYLATDIEVHSRRRALGLVRSHLPGPSPPSAPY